MKRYWVLVNLDGTIKDVTEGAFGPWPDRPTEVHWGCRHGEYYAVDVTAETEEAAKSKALAAIARQDREL